MDLNNENFDAKRYLANYVQDRNLNDLFHKNTSLIAGKYTYCGYDI